MFRHLYQWKEPYTNDGKKKNCITCLFLCGLAFILPHVHAATAFVLIFHILVARNILHSHWKPMNLASSPIYRTPIHITLVKCIAHACGMQPIRFLQDSTFNEYTIPIDWALCVRWQHASIFIWSDYPYWKRIIVYVWECVYAFCARSLNWECEGRELAT